MPTSPIRYSVYFTPLSDFVANTYGDEVDVSDRVFFEGISSIVKTLDSSDYDFGVYSYSELTLTCSNFDGMFNDMSDSRSIFSTIRDRCIVRVLFTDEDGDTLSFRGIINEEGTKADITNHRISFKVLSADSVIRNTTLTGGVADGTLVSEAFFSLLNNDVITSVLNLDVANINPELDFAIDDGSVLADVSTREAINKLLLASNSVMTINSDNDIIIAGRTENTDVDPLLLYGPFDLFGRQNIVDIRNYNTGRHRMFNSIMVNDTVATEEDLITEFGFRQKQITLDFVTDAQTEEDIAIALLDQFSVPKIELEVIVSTKIAKNVKLLDRVSLSHPLRTAPFGDGFLPVVGVTTIGNADMPLPYEFGSIAISPKTGFKVIEITDNPQAFVSTLKLRQLGTSLSDGVFNLPGNCLIDFAVIDEAVICAGGDECDTFNPSVIGAAKIDCTEVA